MGSKENAVNTPAETLAEWRAKELESLRRLRGEAERVIRESRATIDREMGRADQLTGAISALEAENRVYAQAVAEMESGPVAASAPPENDDPEEGLKERAAAAQASTGKKLAGFLAEPTMASPFSQNGDSA